MLKNLSDKSWWYFDEDGKSESLIRWFDTIKLEKGSGIVKIRFHREMLPFLIDLVKENQYITRYELKYVLPMSSMYSPRLYEILKSYINRGKWYFEIDTIKRLLDCEKYTNFKDFNNRVLKKAVEEINTYTDIAVSYGKMEKGRKVQGVIFYMDRKTTLEKVEAWQEIREELDGQMYMDDLIGYQDLRDENAFITERSKAKDEQRKFNEEREKFLKNNKTD